MPTRRAVVLVSLGLAAATAVVFAVALGNDFVDWDDRLNLTENVKYRGLSPAHLRWMVTTTLSGHYIPLTWLTLGVDYTLWGLNPVGYHATNIVIHAANAVLFYLLSLSLLRRAVRLPPTALQVAAMISALFFAVHPLRAESVAWVTERRDVLSGFFFFSTMIAYVRSTEAGSAARRRTLQLVALCTFAMALLSKSIVMTLPLVLVVLDFYPLRRLEPAPATWVRPESLAVWREKLPYAVLAAVGAVVAYHALVTGTLRAPDTEPPWIARPGLVAYSLVFYATKTVLPLNLSALYELPARVDIWDVRFVGSLTIVLLAAATLIALKARWPAGLAVGAYYAIVLAPVSGVVAAGYQLAHDRYSYLSCLGFALLAGGSVGGALAAAQRGRLRRWPARLVVASAALWIVALGTLTSAQAAVWRNSESLWQSAVASEPDCSICRGNLGVVLYQNKRANEALPHLERAVELRPDRKRPRYNLALTLLALGRTSEAVTHLERLRDERPDDTAVLNSLGVALIRLGRYGEAADRLERAVALAPGDAQVRTHYGVALTGLGAPDRGLAHLRRAVEMMPDAIPPRVAIVRAHLALGDQVAAHEHVEIMKRLDPRLAAALDRDAASGESRRER